jgi:hypothetical protein
MPESIRAMFESLESSWDQLTRFLPQFLAGVGLFVIGWFAAWLIRQGLVRLFRLARLELFSEKIGLQSFLVRGGAHHNSSELAAFAVYWILLFCIIMAVLHSLGLDAARKLFERILTYIPSMFVAVLVLIFGALFAKLVRRVARTYLRNVRTPGAEIISTLLYCGIIFIVIAVALEQLYPGGQIVITAFEIAFSGLCLALAIAFGLAGKEIATQILEKLWRNTR